MNLYYHFITIFIIKKCMCTILNYYTLSFYTFISATMIFCLMYHSKKYLYMKNYVYYIFLPSSSVSFFIINKM